MVEIKPIRSEGDYEDALQSLSKLWGAPSGTPEGDQLDILATLIDAYEKEHFPIDAPSAEALAAFEKEEQEAMASSLRNGLVFEIYRDPTGHFVFRVQASSGEVIFRSDSFDTKSDAIHAIKLLQENASRSKIVDLAA